jgi:hypothetical protein
MTERKTHLPTALLLLRLLLMVTEPLSRNERVYGVIAEQRLSLLASQLRLYHNISFIVAILGLRLG